MARTSEINLGLPSCRDLAVFLVLWRNFLSLSEKNECENEWSGTHNLATYSYFLLHVHVIFVGLLQQQICICCRIRDNSLVTTNRTEHTVICLLENVNTLTLWRLKNNVKAGFCPVFFDTRKTTSCSEGYRASPACLSHNSQYECGASVKWYWQGKPAYSERTLTHLPIHPTQISYVVARYRKRDSVGRGRWLTPCAMPRLLKIKLVCIT